MRIIKKFNSFLNEELVAAVESNPVTTPTPTITPTRPMPTRPGITPTEVPSEEDAPLAYGYGDSNDLPEEEGGEYQGQMLLNQLANELVLLITKVKKLTFIQRLKSSTLITKNSQQQKKLLII